MPATRTPCSSARITAPNYLSSSPADADVAQEAAEIGESTPFAGELIGCNARFEIGIEDLDEVLDEINTLIEVQSTLQQATSGYLFNSWNGEVSGPDDGG